jgi:hypothetical protein
MTSKIKKPCVECGHKGTYFTKLDIIICSKCKTLDEYRLITKTNAKKIYLLDDDDLDELDCYYAQAGYCVATYFTKKNIIDLACDKYGVESAELDDHLKKIVDKKMKEKNQRKKLIREKKLTQENKRKEKLTDALNEKKLVLRNDSMLCNEFIKGSKEHSLEYIVETMCRMKYLFEYCHMEKCKDKAYDEYTDTLNAGYFPDSTVFEAAEMMALDKYSNGKYPAKFPWL